MEPESHVDIRLESWLESRPSVGFAPVTVRISNGTSEEHTWEIVSANGYGPGGGMTSILSMTVAGGQTAEQVIYAPATGQTGGSYYYGNLSFKVRGYGISSENAGSLGNNGSYGSTLTEFIAMSRAVGSKHWSPLRNKLDSTGGKGSSTRSDLQGSEVDMAAAPEDWRGYSGIAQLWMEEAEWIAMRPASKAALLDWLALGGRVYILARDASEARAAQLGLPAKVGGHYPVGAGVLALMGWDGTSVPLDDMARIVREAETQTLRVQLSGYDKPWALREEVGELTLKSGLIFGFITIFGILVGPLNLFWLAPPGKRQRMFWTTPLLSLGGSLLLIVVMILQDGIGGEGSRLTLAILQPEQKKLAVIQEQVSRTGVLMGKTFPMAEPGMMQPLELSSSTGYSPLQESRYGYIENGSMRLGDWFASRSVQGHLLQSVRPSRGAIEVFPAGAAGQPPSVLSSIDSPLKRIFVVDDARALWVADDVGTGEKKVMRAAKPAELKAWLSTGIKKMGGAAVLAALEKMESLPGMAFADVADAARLATPTLGSIRWNHDYGFIAGPYIKR